MELTTWADVHGRRLSKDELTAIKLTARRAYEANTHLFEDEAEALEAMGVHPLLLPNRLALAS